MYTLRITTKDSKLIVRKTTAKIKVGASVKRGLKGEQGPPGNDGVIQSIVAGENITVDNTDPANPVISGSSGGGGGGSAGTYSFMAKSSNAGANNGFRLHPYGTELFDNGDVYNQTSSTFTAPEDGLYNFSYTVYAASGSGYMLAAVYVDGLEYARGFSNPNANGGLYGNSVTLSLTAGQTVQVYLFTANNVNYGDPTAYFSGFSVNV